MAQNVYNNICYIEYLGPTIDIQDLSSLSKIIAIYGYRNDIPVSWINGLNNNLQSLTQLETFKGYLIISNSSPYTLFDSDHFCLNIKTINNNIDIARYYHNPQLNISSGLLPDSSKLSDKVDAIYTYDNGNPVGWLKGLPDSLQSLQSLISDQAYLFLNSSIPYVLYSGICATPTINATPTVTKSSTNTPTPTLTSFMPGTNTPTPTNTKTTTPSYTSTPTATITPSNTSTPIISLTPTITKTPSITPSITVSALPITGNNFVNYSSNAIWNGINGNVTTVGTNGRSSYYGTYDQSGNVYEWLENTFGVSNRVIRGGYWFDNALNISAASRNSIGQTTVSAGIGIRLVALDNPSLSQIEFVVVKDLNNEPDNTGYGFVDYEYFISKYEITNQEYVEFLNSVAQTDTYGLFNILMQSNVRGGIIRSGSSGSYIYNSKTNMNNKPANHINWHNAARFANWLNNNRPVGPQDNTTTENGAYTLNGNSGRPLRNSGYIYYIPTENEWYKAAYYKGGSNNAGYWDYATRSDTAPTPVYSDFSGNGIDPSITPTPTQSNTVTPSITPTITPTTTSTPTNSVTPSNTPTNSITPTITISPSISVSNTRTPTFTPTISPTNTVTPSQTKSNTPTLSITPTITNTPSNTKTNTPTKSVTKTPSLTPSITPSNTATPSNTPTISITPSITESPSLTPTNTPTMSITPSLSESPTPTPTITPTVSVTPTTISIENSLLLHFDGDDNSTIFIDSSNNNLLIGVSGDTVITTGNYQFGGTSAYFNGAENPEIIGSINNYYTGDYLVIGSGINLGNNNFTIEFWFNSDVQSDYLGSHYLKFGTYNPRAAPPWSGPSILDEGYSLSISPNNISFEFSPFYATPLYNDIISVSNLVFSNDNYFDGLWHHIAFVRENNDLGCFIDGTYLTSYTLELTDLTRASSGLPILIGSQQVFDITWLQSNNFADSNYYYNGYLDEIRIIKIAAYTLRDSYGNLHIDNTAVFTPPSSPFG
jgi:formylglycine-generating enzyme required for sulfatase activity